MCATGAIVARGRQTVPTGHAKKYATQRWRFDSTGVIRLSESAT
jgi:hypothetical protein